MWRTVALRSLTAIPRSLVAPRTARPFHARAPLCAASIVDTVSTQIKDAMRAKDSERLLALRNMRATFLVAMKESNATSLTDERAVEALRKVAKQRADSIAQYKAGNRDDLVAAEERELAVIESFLPKLADEAQTTEWARAAAAGIGASKPGDAGKVMGAMNKAHKGLFDNAVAKQIVEQMLAAKA